MNVKYVFVKVEKDRVYIFMKDLKDISYYWTQ